MLLSVVSPLVEPHKQMFLKYIHISKTYNYSSYSYGNSTDTLTLSVADTSSNTNSSNISISISKLDDQPPTITSLSANNSSVELKTSSQTQTVTFTAVVGDNVAISNVTLTGATQTNVSGNTYTFQKTYSYSSYSYGTVSEKLTLTVSDTSGNKNTDSIDVTIIKTDDQKPNITRFISDVSTIKVTDRDRTKSVTFTVDVSDNRAINNVSITGATLVNIINLTYTFTKEYDYQNYSEGTTTETVTVVVSDITVNTNTGTVQINIERETEAVEYTMKETEYYLDIVANLNKSINMVDGSCELLPYSINKENPNYQATYKLPEGEVLLNAGILTAKDMANSTVGTFDCVIKVNLSSQGIISSTVNISGNSITSTYMPDDPGLAQHAYWGLANSSSTPSIDKNSADKFTDTLDSTRAKELLSTEIAAIESMYVVKQ